MCIRDSSNGAIKIDENDIRKLSLSSLRSNMGIVTQEVILFNDTIKNNIAYAQKNVSDEAIHEAAEAANALEFIEKTPDGFDTLIGERGAKLSGGQKQRLAISRALLKNPPILILDEATSALDTESEKIPSFETSTLGEEISKIIEKNFKSTGLFNPLKKDSFVQKPDIAHLKPRFEDWRLIKAQALVTGKL